MFFRDVRAIKHEMPGAGNDHFAVFFPRQTMLQQPKSNWIETFQERNAGAIARAQKEQALTV
jgi:hypothetical protein